MCASSNGLWVSAPALWAVGILGKLEMVVGFIAEGKHSLPGYGVLCPMQLKGLRSHTWQRRSTAISRDLRDTLKCICERL